jgi:N-acetylmuramate 1-kinase
VIPDSHAWVQRECRDRWGGSPEIWEPLVPDGSNREFFRVRRGNRSLIALSNPGETSENDAYWNIGRHLLSHGVPAPALYAYERALGCMILEDLGNRSLQEAVGQASGESEIRALYGPALDGLLTFQWMGREGFEERWCYQGPRYDTALMLERESGYFLNAYLKGVLGWEGEEEPLLREFRILAELASRAPTLFLLHRDFQSRNILLPCPGKPHIIDFQGARWGPPQYDVAALVIDPYVDMTSETRDFILGAYVQRLEASGAMTADHFMAHYPVIALHRNLQILGAFAFLGLVKRKPFFLQWIPRALSQLQSLLTSQPRWGCPRLRDCVNTAIG